MTIKEIQKQRLADLLIAEKKILLSQSYKVGEREFVRPELYQVRSEINELLLAGVSLDDNEVKVGRQKRVVFVD